MAQDARLSRLGAGRPRARGARDSRAARRARSHAIQNQLPSWSPGPHQLRARADRAHVSPMSVSPARIKVGFIVGPTGSGKTSLAMTVAERLYAEIVNADSRQLYRGMDIGTAKPSAEERRRVPHHLVDVRAPDQTLDVAEFVAMARAAIVDI